MQKIVVYTDGGSRGNPGPAGIGVVISNGISRKYSEYIGEATNNEAEYQAVIFALKKIKQLLGKEKIKNLGLVIRSDSELLIKQLTGKYKISEPRIGKLFLQVWNLKIDFPKVEFQQISREENKEADRLANEVLGKKQEKLF